MHTLRRTTMLPLGCWALKNAARPFAVCRPVAERLLNGCRAPFYTHSVHRGDPFARAMLPLLHAGARGSDASPVKPRNPLTPDLFPRPRFCFLEDEGKIVSSGRVGRWISLWITCGRIFEHLRQESEECFAAIQLGVIEHPFEQPSEHLADGSPGRDFE